MELNRLDAELVTRMELLAAPSMFAFDATGTTSLLCCPMVAYDRAARSELNARCPRGATHDETTRVLLEMVNDGVVGVFKDGDGFYFEGRPI